MSHRSDVLACAAAMLKSGLTYRTWGNLSARLNEREIVVTPTAIPYAQLTEEDLVVVNLETLEASGPHAPSSELLLHVEVYRQRPEVNFIIHSHQPWASALSILLDLPKMKKNRAKSLGSKRILLSRYAESGSAQLANNVARIFRDQPEMVLIMARHGCIVLGHNADDCLHRIHALEAYAREALDFASPYALLAEEALAPAETIDPALYEDFLPPQKFAEGRVLLFCPDAFAKVYPEKAADIPMWLDDAAQIFGQTIHVLEEDPRESAEARRQARLALRVNDALIIRGRGVIFALHEEHEYEAAQLIFRKNLLADVAASHWPHRDPLSASVARSLHKLHSERQSRLKLHP